MPRGRARSPIEAIADVKGQQAAGRVGTVRRKKTGKLQRQSTVASGRLPNGQIKPHTYDPKTAKEVARLAALTLTREEIAIKLDLRPGQVSQYYEKELKTGAVDGMIDVVQTAYKMAKSQVDGPMTQFWLTHRAGWRKPAERTELTGKDGGPLRQATKVTVYLPDNGRPDIKPPKEE